MFLDASVPAFADELTKIAETKETQEKGGAWQSLERWTKKPSSQVSLLTLTGANLGRMSGIASALLRGKGWKSIDAPNSGKGALVGGAIGLGLGLLSKWKGLKQEAARYADGEKYAAELTSGIPGMAKSAESRDWSRAYRRALGA